jgi:hypothetical protein
MRKPRADLKQQLEKYKRELAEARDHLTESLEQQTATSEVLRVISYSPGELEPVFEAMLANATRLCEASYGALWLSEGDAFRAVALHGPLPAAYTEQVKGALFRPDPDTTLVRATRSRQPAQVADLRASQAYLAPFLSLLDDNLVGFGRRARKRRRAQVREPPCYVACHVTLQLGSFMVWGKVIRTAKAE